MNDDPPRQALFTAGNNDASRALAYLLAGPLVYGLLGWLADRALHTHFLVGIGIVLGAVLGAYMIIRRFGTSDRTKEDQWQR